MGTRPHEFEERFAGHAAPQARNSSPAITTDLLVDFQSS